MILHVYRSSFLLTKGKRYTKAMIRNVTTIKHKPFRYPDLRAFFVFCLMAGMMLYTLTPTTLEAQADSHVVIAAGATLSPGAFFDHQGSSASHPRNPFRYTGTPLAITPACPLDGASAASFHAAAQNTRRGCTLHLLNRQLLI